MKRMIGLILVLLMTVSGAAFADATVNTDAATAFLPVLFVNGGNETLGLIGSGDSARVIQAFASKDADFFEDFWSTLAAMTPAATISGNAGDLTFVAAKEVQADGSVKDVVIVSRNGDFVVSLDGTGAYMILSEANVGTPVVDPNCSLVIWTPGTMTSIPVLGMSGNLCPNCGLTHDGSKDHETVISTFCADGHTVCMGDPVHYCEDCGKEYPCSKSNSHTQCLKCQQPWCYKEEGDHKTTACGHRGCEIFGEESKHAKCEHCDGYLCDGKTHQHQAACGVHDAGESGNHNRCVACGAWACDGQVHILADCGHHHATESGDHNLALCGHYGCDIAANPAGHGVCTCGKYRCNGADHSACA